MGFSVMLWGAEKLVPVEYWCPYGTLFALNSYCPRNVVALHVIIVQILYFGPF